MRRFLYFVWKRLLSHRKVLLAFLAILPMLLVLVYNPPYKKLETTDSRLFRTANEQTIMRNITNINPSAGKTTSDHISSEITSKHSTKITQVNNYTDVTADDKKIGSNNSVVISSTINHNQDTARTMLKSKVLTSVVGNNRETEFETKPTSTLVLRDKTKSETERNTKSNVIKSNESETPHKAIAINSTKTELMVRPISPTTLNTSKTVSTESKTNNSNNISNKKVLAGVTSNQILHKTPHPDNHIKRISHKSRTKSLSFRNPLENIITDNVFEPYCAMYSNSFKYLIWPESPSNLNDWGYKRKRNCPNFTIPENINNTKRVKYTLKCGKKYPRLIPSFTYRSDDIQVVSLDDACLAAFTNSCCNDERGIPNLVHYVWYFKNEMNFPMFTSMLSVIRFVRPCLILFHGEYLPHGKYWDYILRIYPNIFHVFTVRPLTIFGKSISHHEHSGDIMRMHALMQLGGMYFDTDVIVLRDLEPLREYNMTLCYQETGYLLNAFIMTKKNATFLNLWMDGYRKDYRNHSYEYNSMFYSKDLANNRTDLVHVEQGTLCSPLVLIGEPVNSTMIYNWSKLFGYHLYARTIHFPLSGEWIKHFNSTVGAMVRHIIYGNKELCEGPVHVFN